MASLRRTKNYATEAQTPMFLYNILKQLDLRSIDWNKVANSLGISNGHAARMRYSRMKTQFEGGPQPKVAKPKKEKQSDAKPAKDKPKNKRLLENDDDSAPVASPQTTLQYTSRLDPESKRIKLDPHPYVNAWGHPLMDPVGQYAGPFWGQPIIKLEPMPSDTFPLPAPTLTSSPRIKPEPDTPTAATSHLHAGSSVTNQEPSSMLSEHCMTDMDEPRVKQEPGTTVSDQTFGESNSCTTSVTSSYPMAKIFSSDVNSSDLDPPMPFGGMPTYSVPPSIATSAYPPFHGLNHGFSWFSSGFPPSAAASSIVGVDGSLTLNPYASTYEDMLNMPLYNHPLQSSELPPSVVPNQPQNAADSTARQPSTTNLATICGDIEHGAGDASLLPDNSDIDSETNLCRDIIESSTCLPDVSEVEPDTEHGGELAAAESANAMEAGPKIKMEPVEL